MSYSSSNRRSIRLPGYDYSQNGAYFITICIQDKESLFGEIADGEMKLNEFGNIVHDIWKSLPKRFSVMLDAFQIMPNHIHMIIQTVGAPLVVAHSSRAGIKPAPTVGDIIGAYKSLTTHKYIMGVKNDGWKSFEKRLWQRNYYEHIIRDDGDLQRIREYIKSNPNNWEMDKLNM